MLLRFRLLLWIAQGFGLGRAPVAPGTFGSIGGLAWFALLIWPSNWLVFFTGLVAGCIASVLVGGSAERLLNQKDPSSVVLDEIVALPICFAGWLSVLWIQDGRFPGLGLFFGSESWWKSCIIFLFFRFFDIVKPWPVYQVQSLPRGWGLTADDVLAVGYVNGCVLAAIWVGVW